MDVAHERDAADVIIDIIAVKQQQQEFNDHCPAKPDQGPVQDDILLLVPRRLLLFIHGFIS